MKEMKNIHGPDVEDGKRAKKRGGRYTALLENCETTIAELRQVVKHTDARPCIGCGAPVSNANLGGYDGAVSTKR
jgi:hypothetical protein